MGADLNVLTELVRRLFPGAVLLDVKPLAPDVAREESTAKAGGYGEPLRFRIVDASGQERSLVFRTATDNDYGHDRRSDRAQGMLLAYDTFASIPSHVQALDVGLIRPDGGLRSVREGGEAYLVTSWASGEPYATDLRRIAAEGTLQALDVDRCDALARYLLELHVPIAEHPATYVRAIRDLLGHGEGIFGIVDGYPPDVPEAPPQRLQAIERQCLEWRWRLKDQTARLVRTHGDFHPFNVVFDEGANFTLLDASRGCMGDRADDVTAMTINYVFFALDQPKAWRRGLGVLWRRFWRIYLQGTSDSEVLQAAPPFLAWRALVIANPSFYPDLSAEARDRLLALAEGALSARRFDPEVAEKLFP